MSIASQYIRGVKKLVKVFARSGLTFPILFAEVDNPSLTATYTTTVAVTAKVASISSIYATSVA